MDEIESLVRAFEDGTLPRARWTHRAHLTMGMWYLMRLPAPVAAERIVTGIQRYNAAVGVLQTPTGGYHETITQFYIWLIRRFLSTADRSRPLAELSDELFRVHGGPNVALAYYSRERLMSWEARTDWLEPDLKPLEAIAEFASADPPAP
jgi:hypothetical protein